MAAIAKVSEGEVQFVSWEEKAFISDVMTQAHHLHLYKKVKIESERLIKLKSL